MTNELSVFNFETNEVRTVMIDKEAWFVGKDVANALGYKKSRNALTTHVDTDDKKDAPIQGDLGGTQNMTLINESGVYSLIFGSKLDSAKRFKKWVTSEVLPSIRKTGGYQAKQLSAMEMLKLHSEAFVEVDQRLDDVTEKVDTYIENQQLNATDYGAISTAVNNRVHTYATINRISKSSRSPLFKDINSQIKQVTGAGNRSRIKSKDYDKVIEFIGIWEPSAATKSEVMNLESDL